MLKIVFRFSDGGSATFQQCADMPDIEEVIKKGYWAVNHQDSTLIYLNWDHIVGIEIEEVEETV
jgi:hypothetical protein